MNPSSSSNAEPASGPTFKVACRELSADLGTADVTESGCELGSLSAGELTGLLVKLAALDPTTFGEADPHLLVSSRRGRFIVKPGRGKLLLRSTGEQDAAYFELPVDQTPAYLDGKDPVAGSLSEPAAIAAEPTGTWRSNPALAVAMFVVAAALVASSAFLTFRTDEVDPVSAYTPVTAAGDVAAVRQKIIGTFATGDEPDDRTLVVRADDTLTYQEPAAGAEAPDERSGPFAVMRRRSDQVTVLRVEGFGTIEVRADGSLLYAGESYRRRNPAGQRAAR